jgi:DNA-binding PadR family transcriptional regulator
VTWHHYAHHHRRHRRGRRGLGPWGARGRFFGPGEVRLALLSLLGERAQHGYELMKGLEERSGGTYRASAGTVYPTLQQLEDEGLAASEPSEGKRVYRITDAGRQEIEGEAETVEEIWQRADDWGSWSDIWDPEASELVRPAIRLVKAALRSVVRSDDPNRIDEVREILRDARRRIRALDGEEATRD